MTRLPLGRLAFWLLRVVVYVAASLLALAAVLLGAAETGWGKNQLRHLIVRQANGYLAGSVEIGRIDGSLLSGLRLADIRVSKDGDTIASVDELALSYSIRELFESGRVIRRIALTRPHIVAARTPDGRWNLASLLRRERQNTAERAGPGRSLRILAIEVSDGDVEFRDPLTFDSVRVPSRFADLNVRASLDYQPVSWTVNLVEASWVGDAANLTVHRLSGTIADGAGGWTFDRLAIRTPQSDYTVTGRVDRTHPATLDLRVDAARFAFQEWSGVLGALKNIAVESSFSVTLKGPLDKLAAGVALESTGGNVRGAVTLDTTVPGWHGAGDVRVGGLNLARWLNRADRPSDVTGRVVFDLDLDLGRHFPRGSYSFDGPHVAYLDYEISDFKARGTLTRTDAIIAQATGTAYGASLHIAGGSVGIDSPNAYHFVGGAAGLDLRRLPPSIPVTRVESSIALDAFEVAGRFEPPSITGTATLGDSEYLGAAIQSGAVGSIDTTSDPVRYAGDGEIADVDVHRFGRDLNVDWMQDPRWAGVVSGRFHVAGAGSDAATMTIDGGGHLASASLFDGRLFDADVALHVAAGSLTGSYDGQLANVEGALAFADPRFDATLTGRVRATFAVRDLLTRSTDLADYEAAGSIELAGSTIRGIAIARGSATGKLAGATFAFDSLQVQDPRLEGTASGLLALDDATNSQVDYDITRADLALVGDFMSSTLSGAVAAHGQMSGPMSALRLSGSATFADLTMDGAGARTTDSQYDLTFPVGDPARAFGKLSARASALEVSGRHVNEATAAVTLNNRVFDVELVIGSDAAPGSIPASRIVGAGIMHADRQGMDLTGLTIAVGRSPAWRLEAASPPPAITWNESGVQTAPLSFADAATGTERATLSGTWRADGTGALRLTTDHVYLDSLVGEPGRPGQYGGIVNLDAVLRGTREHPTVAARLDVTEGRVRKLTFARLAGTIDYADDAVRMDLRLDQGPDTWLTATGRVPVSPGEGRVRSNEPIDLKIASSPIALGLMEGVTDVIRDASGQLTVDVTVNGTAQDPRFTGTVDLANAAFLVTASGARYKNGRAGFVLTPDRIDVSALHLEDRNGRALDVTGRVDTRALSVGDLALDVTTRRFEILRNEVGSADVAANLTLRGSLAAPVVAGSVSILSGELRVDEILARAVYQPYATAAAAAAPGAEVDAIAALNPWNRLALDLTLHSPGTLKLTGDNVQATQGTPLGLGSFNLRATGDLYFYKDAGQPLYVSGSFDSITGSFAFQGRRFDLDPTSSINFRGDYDPGLFVTVTRVIQGVETRVTIAGSLDAPELRLASTPVLDASDILSLIVFNSTTADLTGQQQQELAVRAGTLAYGFIATPLVGALQRSLGLETLEIAPPSGGGSGASVTVGNELVPGLVAQFTREFGSEPYDEATVEYYLSRILRLRATFSDAQSLIDRSPFRRVERAGLDLIMSFSF